MYFDPEKENACLREVQASSEDVFDGVILHVKRDTVTLPNGAEAVREVIRHAIGISLPKKHPVLFNSGTARTYASPAGG